MELNGNRGAALGRLTISFSEVQAERQQRNGTIIGHPNHKPDRERAFTSTRTTSDNTVTVTVRLIIIFDHVIYQYFRLYIIDIIDAEISYE